MNRKHCKEALDHYKKFVVRMEGVGNFFKVAEVLIDFVLIFFIIFPVHEVLRTDGI